MTCCTWVSSTNKSDHHDIAEILLKVSLKTITLNPEHIEKTFTKIVMAFYKVQFTPSDYAKIVHPRASLQDKIWLI
jgi:hypothetical protein